MRCTPAKLSSRLLGKHVTRTYIAGESGDLRLGALVVGRDIEAALREALWPEATGERPRPTHLVNATTSVGHRLNKPMPDHASTVGYLVSVMLGRLAAAPLSGAVSV